MSQDLNDILGADLSTTETGFPVIAPGVYAFQVGQMELKDSKSKAGAKNLSIECKLTQPAADRNGKVIKAGFPLYHTISLAASDKYDPKKNLAQFKEAVLGTKDGTFMPLEQYMGQSFTARVKIESSEQYGDQNRIDAFIKKS